MITEEQLDWLGDFAEYFVNDDYCRDRGYAAAISTLLDAHFLHDGIFSDKLKEAIEEELEIIYNYIASKYIKVSYEKTIMSTEWKRIDPYKQIKSLLKNQYYETPNPTIVPKTIGHNSKCSKCGLELGTSIHYVCSHFNCPTGLGPTIC